MDTMPMHGFGTSIAPEDEEDGVPSMLAVLGWRSTRFSLRSARVRGRRCDGWHDRVVQGAEKVDTELRARYIFIYVVRIRVGVAYLMVAAGVAAAGGVGLVAQTVQSFLHYHPTSAVPDC
jgi:hypothetical protein